MTTKTTHGINIEVKLGPHTQYGLASEFEFTRKVSGCIDMHDAAEQTIAMLDDLRERLAAQIRTTYVALDAPEDES